MLNEKLKLKIELLEEQLENVERSGFYSEQQIDIISATLRYELRVIQNLTALEFLSLKELHEIRRQIDDVIRNTSLKTKSPPNFKFSDLKKNLDKMLFPNPQRAFIRQLLTAPITAEQYLEGRFLYDQIFTRHPSDIVVTNPEILTPNNPQA